MLQNTYTYTPTGSIHPAFGQAFAEASASCHLDLIGATQFLLFLYPLYERTFVEEITYSARDTLGQPFKLQFDEDRQGYDIANGNRLWRVLENAMAAICQDRALVYGIGNSGGMDSRTILYLARRMDISIKAYTLGDAPSDAAYIGSKVSKRLGIQNHPAPIDGDFLQRFSHLLIRRRPMYSLMYAWYLGSVSHLPTFDRHLTGFNGDNMLGSHLPAGINTVGNRQHLHDIIYSHYLTNSPEALRQLLREPFQNLPDLARADFDAHIRQSRHTRPENIFEEFNFMSRQLRFIQQSVNFDFCGRYSWKSPFFTPEFMQFAQRLTFEERFGRRLYRNTLKDHMPELANLRFEREALSLADTRDSLRSRGKQWLWQYGPRWGIKLNRGNHKDVKKWLFENGALDFLGHCLAKPSGIFAEIFNIERIREQLTHLFDTNIHLLMALFTVEQWLKENENRINL
jgi:hypothetical protein